MPNIKIRSQYHFLLVATPPHRSGYHTNKEVLLGQVWGALTLQGHFSSQSPSSALVSEKKGASEKWLKNWEHESHLIGQMPSFVGPPSAVVSRARCFKVVVPKLQQASWSPGELVTAQMTEPMPEFLVQSGWVWAWESAFLTILGDMDAADLGTTSGIPLPASLLQAATLSSMGSTTERLKGTVFGVVLATLTLVGRTTWHRV